MSMLTVTRGAVTGLSLALCGAAPAAHACATCFGQSDSALAQGMNFGILTLLGVVAVVLSGIAGFFVYLGYRARALAAPGNGAGAGGGD
ncbi:MAG: hypothetical protein FJ387_07945 [Verrucomicrobia bacterium]|nr:hypothetical protein [Verrucomicrobiota bacterium]